MNSYSYQLFKYRKYEKLSRTLFEFKVFSQNVKLIDKI